MQRESAGDLTGARSVLEGAAGKPGNSSGAAALAEFLERHDDPGTRDAYLKWIASQADDPQRRRTMGLAGRRFVERYYQWHQNCLAMEEIYRAVLESDAPRGVPIYRQGVVPDLHVPPEG